MALKPSRLCTFGNPIAPMAVYALSLGTMKDKEGGGYSSYRVTTGKVQLNAVLGDR